MVDFSSEYSENVHSRPNGKSFLDRFSSGFVFLMRNMHENAWARLPQRVEAEEVRQELRYLEEDSFDHFDGKLHEELLERYDLDMARRGLPY